jgi:nucleoside phosphorylase
VRHDLFLDVFSPDYRRYFGLFQPREQVVEPLRGEPLAHYEWLSDVLYAAALIARKSVFIPHAFVLQCPLLSRLIENNRLLIRESVLRMPMGDDDVGESLERMRRTYLRREFPRLFTADAESIVAAISEGAISRRSRLGRGIVTIIEQLPETQVNGKDRWANVSKTDVNNIVKCVRSTLADGAPVTFESALERAPLLSSPTRRLMFGCINYSYGIQHVREYGLAVLNDIPGIHDHFGVDGCCPAYSYRRFWSLFSRFGLNRDALRICGSEGIVVLRSRTGVELLIQHFARALRQQGIRSTGTFSEISFPEALARHIDGLARRQAEVCFSSGLSPGRRQRRLLPMLGELADIWLELYSGVSENNGVALGKKASNGYVSAPKTPRPQRSLQPRVALLTIIGPELDAVKKAFSIPESARVVGDGHLRYEVRRETRHSGLILLEVYCIAKPGNAASAAAATRILNRGAKFMLLCGIAAGYRNKVKIGDVVVPRIVVDTTVKVVEAGAALHRSQATPPLLGVLQMNAAAAVNSTKWRQVFKKVFDDKIVPESGREQEYRTHVSEVPELHDAAILSDNVLIRDSAILVDAANTLHQQIRAGEMEAAGFVMACNDEYPPVPWFIIRGISDFGDEFKNDRFHKLAASAVASYAAEYIKEVLDLRIWHLRSDN